MNGYTADNKEFYSFFKRAVPDFRMRDVELLVRFFAFNYFLPRYVGNLKPLLDQTCDALNQQWPNAEARIRAEAENCREAISATVDVFEDAAFRRWSGTVFERPFNRAVFDVMTFYGKDGNVRDAMRGRPSEVVAAFKETCAIPEFNESITTTTKSRQAILTRLSLWGAKLQALLELPLPIPVADADGRIAYTEV